MALRAETLEHELARFCDSAYGGFIGSPPARRIARERWAEAFRIYIAEVADHIGLTALAPPQATIQRTPGPTFAIAVEAEFRAALGLAPGMSRASAADDFANAWRAGLRAVSAGIGGVLPPATSPVHAFAGWTATTPGRDLIDERRDRLQRELEALFATPAIASAPRLRALAAAFHRATVELTAMSTVSAATITYR